MIRIVVDAMGGDNAPGAAVKGALAALADERISVILTGREKDITAALGGALPERMRIIDAPEIIGADEAPAAAIKSKKQSSIVVGLNLLKNGEADAFVSAGNTGAVLAGATVIVGRIKGILRPALAVLLPNAKGFSFLIDAGANVDAKPEYLPQFAQMGSIYMENVIGINNPRVAIVNIGAEKEKGNALTKEAYPLLENAGVNFTGNIEARDIALGGADVLVCDAFIGNVILKYSEGFATALLGMVKKELLSTTLSKIGAFLSKNAFRNLKKSFDYSEVGGAPFLGLNALVVKAHGSSDAKAISAAIRQCVAFVENDITGKIKEKLHSDME
ncbi:MAG: phosphate acyltransferase PlsX [Defluviitaleaceae bacterium]|nr:phosphate acyltransferase PlsX [Defluviitaleaceae bacterium]